MSPEMAALYKCEKVIENGLGTFLDVGFALVEIRDNDLFLAAGFDSFEAYMQQRWPGADERRLTEFALREMGNSTRQIAEIVGVNQSTVTRDLKAAPGDANASPQKVIGKDGKQYPAKSKPREPKAIKPAGVNHPARFSDEIIETIAGLIVNYHRILDPFAGTGRIHELQDLGHETVGVEIESEWADMHKDTRVGNALDLSFFQTGEFDAIATSPTYGNRLADHHNASDPQSRRSYRHDLGRELDSDNSGAMQWGAQYMDFHRRAWTEITRVLRPEGRFILNIKDHQRNFEHVDVTAWHVQELMFNHDMDLVAIRPIITRGMPAGENDEARVPVEYVIAFDYNPSV